MKYKLVTKEEAIKQLQNSPGDTVLVATYDYEKEESSKFSPSGKSECESIIKCSGSVSSTCDDFVKKLECFSELQTDLENIKHEGVLKIILLRG